MAQTFSFNKGKEISFNPTSISTERKFAEVSLGKDLGYNQPNRLRVGVTSPVAVSKLLPPKQVTH